MIPYTATAIVALGILPSAHPSRESLATIIEETTAHALTRIVRADALPNGAVKVTFVQDIDDDGHTVHMVRVTVGCLPILITTDAEVAA